MVKYIRESLLKTPGKPNPPTYGVLQEDGLAEVVRPMGLNESLFEPSPRVLEAIVDNLDKIGRYPDAQPPRLSKKISNMFELLFEKLFYYQLQSQDTLFLLYHRHR